MRAVVITPGRKDSDRLVDVPDPEPEAGEALVQVLSVGVDGTDDELASGQYGEAPEGENELIIGHESLGRVVEPAGDLTAGQLVAAIVRRPDPVPCLNCAYDEWDYCLNGRYTERGIKGRHGFLAEYYSEHPKYLVRVPDELERYREALDRGSEDVKAVVNVAAATAS
jgi:threonine dehydrogenase-like Zn-dependent dehydrogenase